MVLDDTIDSEVEVQEESLHWWQLSIQDSETMKSSDSQSVHAQSLAKSEHEQLEKLRYESDYAEMRSALDVLCTGCSVDPKLVGFVSCIVYGALVNICRMLLIHLRHRCLKNSE